jgi:hypothetical protein
MLIAQEDLFVCCVKLSTTVSRILVLTASVHLLEEKVMVTSAAVMTLVTREIDVKFVSTCFYMMHHSDIV